MALGIGDFIPDDCTDVAPLLLREFRVNTGNILQRWDFSIRGILPGYVPRVSPPRDGFPLADPGQYITEGFDQSLEVCEDQRVFGEAGKLFRLRIRTDPLPPGFFLWDKDDTELVARRYNYALELDTGWGTGGEARYDLSNDPGFLAANSANFVGTQRDGKLLATANGTNQDDSQLIDNIMLRFTASGALDPDWGTGGRVNLFLDTAVHFNSIQGRPCQRPDDEGAIAYCQWGDGPSRDQITFCTLAPDGTPRDRVLADLLPGQTNADTPDALCQLANGNFVANQTDQQKLGIWDESGALATSVAYDKTDLSGLDLVAQRDGGWVYLKSTRLTFEAQPHLEFRRYSAGGTLLAETITDDLPYPMIALSSSVGSNGKTLVGGFDGNTQHLLLVQFNADGSVDTGFGTGGVLTAEATTSLHLTATYLG